jgi:hypothetical protein
MTEHIGPKRRLDEHDRIIPKRFEEKKHTPHQAEIWQQAWTYDRANMLTMGELKMRRKVVDEN